DRIAATLRQLADPAEACRALVALANAAGGRDNVTAVVVDVVDDQYGAAESPGPGATAAASLATLLGPSTTSTPSTPASDHRDVVVGPDAPIDPTAALSMGRAGTGLQVGFGAAAVAGPGRRAGWRRRLTPRVGLFLVALIGLMVAAWVAIGVWADRNFFVGATDGAVVVYRGRPDGVLWFSPELVERTDIELSELTSAQLQLIEEHPRASTAQEALDLVRRQITAVTTPTTILRRPATTLNPLATVPSTATVPAPSASTAPATTDTAPPATAAAPVVTEAPTDSAVTG
ncbi:MAG: hypothetical protein ACKV2O_00820, partial [Acidimicrobiales bacterium]